MSPLMPEKQSRYAIVATIREFSRHFQFSQSEKELSSVPPQWALPGTALLPTYGVVLPAVPSPHMKPASTRLPQRLTPPIAPTYPHGSRYLSTQPSAPQTVAHFAPSPRENSALEPLAVLPFDRRMAPQ